jgi:hypothetical protein
VRRPSFLAEEWTSDTSLVVMLASLALLLFVALPLQASQYSLTARLLTVSCYTALGFACVAGLTRSTMSRVVGVLLALVPVGFAWAEALRPGQGVDVLRAAVSLVVMLLFSTVALRLVLRPGPVTARQIAGSVAVYLLVALTFGEAFWLLHLHDHRAISFQDAPMSSEALRADFVYFSIATLTTLGFGDMLPVTTPARVLVTMEALFGQLYLVLLVGRLVSSPKPSRTAEGPE